MSPTIRIDEDVYEGLKQLADPFEDTPNTVIRKLLVSAGALSTANAKVSSVVLKTARGKLTPQPVYEAWLLYILWHDFNGKGNKQAIVSTVRKAMEEARILTDADYETVSTGEAKCENTIAWGRKSFVDSGIIKQSKQRGVWELTPKGIEEAKKLQKTALPKK